jgi:hypothetical protein
MRRAVVGCPAGLLFWACVSSAPKGEILSLSPSTVTEGETRYSVLIEGRGLGDVAHLKLDDKDSARITPVTVYVGGMQAIVLERPSRNQIHADFPALPPGDYDVSVRSGTVLTAEVVGAFHIEPARDGATSSNSDTNEAAVSNSADEADVDAYVEATSSEFTSGPDESSTVVASTARTSSDGLDAGSSSAPSTKADGAAPTSDGDAGQSAKVSDAGTDASLQSSATSDAGVAVEDDADARASSVECGNATGDLLFGEDYELGDFSRWTFDGNVGQDTCQTTEVNDARVWEGELSLSSTLTCAPEDQDEHYAALQFAGDMVLSQFDNSDEGIDAPNGVVVSFELWTELGFGGGAEEWVSFLLLSGTCDWSDTVLSVASTGSGDTLGISHGDVNGGSELVNGGAPPLADGEWTRVTVYVNYYEQVLSVWQDGVFVTRANFVRPGNTLCHVWFGAAFGPAAVDSQVFEDNFRIWRLDAPLTDPDSEPCLATDDE